MTETQFANIAQLQSLTIHDSQDPATESLRQSAQSQPGFSDFRETSEVDVAMSLVLSPEYEPLYAVREDLDGVIEIKVVFAHLEAPQSQA